MRLQGKAVAAWLSNPLGAHWRWGHLSNIANFDGLTGLYNHRYFQEALTKEIARAERLGYPVSLMMIDVDHSREYNDNFGAGGHASMRQ